MLRRDTKDSSGGASDAPRYAQKFSRSASPLSLDPKLGKRKHSRLLVNEMRASVLKLTMGVVLLYTVYMLGYSSAFRQQAQVQSDLNPTSDRNLRDGELFVEEEPQESKEEATLKAIEHMQGFSEAYPKYQLNSTAQEIYQEASESEDDYQSDEAEVIVPTLTISSDISDSDLFANYEEYSASPDIEVPSTKARLKLPYNLPKRNLWWAVKTYESHYRSFPIKSVIPRLKRNVQLTVDEFHTRFRRIAQPVVFNFENLRQLGFETENHTLQELKLMFPFDAKDTMSKVQSQFVANGIRRADEELDLGPGLVAIEKDEALAKKGKLRSFPRNLKVKQEAINKLNVQRPPLLKEDDDSLWQLPTVWMGTSTSDTRFHHDCCDNFVMMISGTKRFTLAPASDWRVLNPQCVGKLKALCWANVNDPSEDAEAARKQGAKLTKAEKKAIAAMKHVNRMTVDVGPGDVLYMPAGWFHHIRNLEPTVMVNWWTKGKETCALSRAKNFQDY